MRTSLIALALLLCAGCPKETKDEPEQGSKLRAECSKPSYECWKACIKRDASGHCTTCCDDQAVLCHERRPHDFEKCKQEP